MEQGRPQQHLLVAAFPFQGHINPALALAERVARATGARVTISTAVSAHRRMFPDGETSDGAIAFVPYSDGFDEGFKWFGDDDPYEYERRFYRVGADSLSAVLDKEAARGRPVTFMAYTLSLPWVAEVARKLGIPCALYWIQPATVLATYYHYFHAYGEEIDAHAHEPDYEVTLPCLRPMRIRDLPTFITSHETPIDVVSFNVFQKSLESAELGARSSAGGDGAKPTVLVNTVDVLESDALASLQEHWDLLAVGPMIRDESSGDAHDIYKQRGKKYLHWLDTKAAASVVYISFGSISVYKPRQLQEIKKALADGGRPFLWVIREHSSDEAASFEDIVAGERGMIVGWCNQVEVLRHRAVGCFVTHCGWNSTLESVACGVPMVVVPQWTDQETNAQLVVEEWKAGVRGATVADEDGVVIGAEELKRCIDAAMSDVAIRSSVQALKEKVSAAVADDGPSDRRLKGLLAGITGGSSLNQELESF